MQIEAVQDAVLSNEEVLKHFDRQWQRREAREKQASVEKLPTSKPSANYASMHRDVTTYFKTGAEAGALPDYLQRADGSIRQLIEKLKNFGLTKSEVVMILNLKPTDAVFLDVIIEELDLRIPDSNEQENLLVVINEILATAEAEEGDDTGN